MSRIVVTTAGTLGDFVPFLALGRALQGRGHHVVMAVNPAMRDAVERAGLAFAPCGRPFGPDDVRRKADLYDRPEPQSPKEHRAQLRALELDRTMRDLIKVTSDRDLLISSSLQGTGGWVHELTGVPWINATIFAMEFPHEHDPGPSARAVTGEAAELERALFDYRNEIRAEFGLSPVADEQWVERYWSKRCVLLASSPHFSRPILDRFPQVRMTGFWFDDRPVDEGSIDPGLRAFLDSGPAPIVLSFSSLPLREPGPVVRLHVEAARSIGMRLVIQRGWGGLEASAISENIDISHVCFTDHVPHSWLFARVSAVVHHGGIGTTAMALRHGCPMLVEPYCNDQFFNSGQVAALGVGAAVSPEGLSIEILGELLGAVVFDPSIRRRADELATLIRSERGLDLACELVDGQLPA